MLKILLCQEILIGMSIVVLRGNNLEIQLGVGCFNEPSLKSSPNESFIFIQKRGSIPNSNQLTNLETIILFIFGEALQFEAAMPQLRTYHMDLHPSTHVQLGISTINVSEICCV